MHGYGTVFRVMDDGAFTNLVVFDFFSGAHPHAGLTLGPDGAFYGTTVTGGQWRAGTVFRVTSDGELATMGAFAIRNGQGPRGLTFGSDGLLYGTTVSGGAYPFSGLVKARDGMFYGTAGGGTGGWGPVYRVTPSGRLTTLVHFARDFTGVYPEAGLVEGNDGALYGTTTQGTFSPDTFGGTVFRVTTHGELSAVCSFAEADGHWPAASLTQAQDGAFYGTCEYRGGASNGGTVWRLDPAVHLAPPKTVAQGLEFTFKGLPRTSCTLLRATNVSGDGSCVSNVIPTTRCRPSHGFLSKLAT